MGGQVQVSAPNKSDDQGLTKLFQQSEYHSSSLGEDIGHTGLNQQQDSIIMNDHKGRLPLPNRMNFWKNSKWPLTPPHFLKIMLQIFYNAYGRIYARRHRPDSIS